MLRNVLIEIGQTWLCTEKNADLTRGDLFFCSKFQALAIMLWWGQSADVFRTSIYASAVCVYNISSLDRAFSGPYKYQVDAQMAWGRMPNKAAGQQVYWNFYCV